MSSVLLILVERWLECLGRLNTIISIISSSSLGTVIDGAVCAPFVKVVQSNEAT